MAKRQQTDQCLEQCGLARAVRADNSHARAVRNLKAEVMEDNFISIPYADILNFETMRDVRHLIYDWRLRDALSSLPSYFKAFTIWVTSYFIISM